MKKNDILDLTVCGIVKAVRERELSASDVLEAYIASAEASEADVNAYITRTCDLAREQARRADERIADGDIPALCGVPFAVKDNLAVIDYEKCTSCGMCVEVCPVHCLEEGSFLCGSRFSVE